MVKQNLFRLLFSSLLFIFTWTAQAASVNALLHNANDPVLGDPKGAVTVIEFFDYQCSHCANMAPIMARIIKANPNVRFVFKEYPIMGELSWTAARAALAANLQGKYEEFNNALYTSGITSKDSILEIANSLGLDVKKFQRDMQSRKINNQLNENIRLAKQLNVEGTPSFYIGKTNAASSQDLKHILGEASESELQEAIIQASS